MDQVVTLSQLMRGARLSFITISICIHFRKCVALSLLSLGYFFRNLLILWRITSLLHSSIFFPRKIFISFEQFFRKLVCMILMCRVLQRRFRFLDGGSWFPSLLLVWRSPVVVLVVELVTVLGPAVHRGDVLWLGGGRSGNRQTQAGEILLVILNRKVRS